MLLPHENLRYRFANNDRQYSALTNPFDPMPVLPPLFLFKTASRVPGWQNLLQKLGQELIILIFNIPGKYDTNEISCFNSQSRFTGFSSRWSLASVLFISKTPHNLDNWLILLRSGQDSRSQITSSAVKLKKREEIDALLPFVRTLSTLTLARK